MSAERLQASIRRTKTPVALVLDPREDRLEKKYLKNFTDLYGDCPMAHAEALRYHGSQSISQAAGKLPAVMLRAEPYLRQGFMGMDVLSNLVIMAKNQGLYTIVDARFAGTEPWLRGGINADAVTILPYGGAESCRVAETSRLSARVSKRLQRLVSLADSRFWVFTLTYTMVLTMRSILLRWHSTLLVLWHSRKLCRRVLRFFLSLS